MAQYVDVGPPAFDHPDLAARLCHGHRSHRAYDRDEKNAKPDTKMGKTPVILLQWKLPLTGSNEKDYTIT
jgi:hypothetical protein